MLLKHHSPFLSAWIWFPLLLLIGVFVGFSLSRLVPESAPNTSDRSSAFSPLDVYNHSLVHIRRGTCEQIGDDSYEPSDQFSWQLHLPQGKQWNLCWAFGRFSRDGVPTAAAGSCPLPSTNPNEHPELLIRIFRNVESGWRVDFGHGAVPVDETFKTWLVPIPDAQGPTIWHTHQSFVTAAGEESTTVGWVAETFTGEKPIVILRLGEANMNGFGLHDPFNGILVWIEQAGDDQQPADPADKTPKDAAR